MIEYDSEKYISASEIAKSLRIAQGTCKSNVLPMLTQYHLPGRRWPVYKLAEVEELSRVRVVERQVQPLTLVSQESSEVRKEA